MKNYIVIISFTFFQVSSLFSMTVKKPKTPTKTVELQSSMATFANAQSLINRAQDADAVKVSQPEPAVSSVAYPILPSKDKKSVAENQVVSLATQTQSAAAHCALALAVASTQPCAEEELVLFTPFYFNGKVDDFSKRIKMCAKQREEAALSLESRLGREDQEKIKREFPKMPEFIIKYVLGRTYESDKEFQRCNERYYLLELCDVGFPYLNSESRWCTSLKIQFPHLHDIEAQVLASSMVQSAIKCMLDARWFARYVKERDVRYDSASRSGYQHTEHSRMHERKKREGLCYLTLLKLWQQTQASENPADKQMLKIIVPLKLEHPKE